MMYQNDVEEFMAIGGQEFPTQQGCRLHPDMKDNDPQIQLYMDLICEEYLETLHAYKNGNVIELADGLADMVWVIMGMASTMDIEFEEIWEEVRRSNMSKFVDGIAIRNPDTGKIMKPPTFSEPDLKTVLGV
jgi:predicted HAD superfamily Cof-like phosphohydrolase